MEKKELLDVQNLEVQFEMEDETLTAVSDVSFDIKEGEIVGLVGESGSGKSVTARAIMRILDKNGRINADAINFKGENLLHKSEKDMQDIRGGEIGMIFQDPMSSLNPVISVGEQIAEVYRHHVDTGESADFWSEMRRKFITGTSKESESWRRAVELLEKVGIPNPEERAHEYPHQLSGGMRQRVGIAGAIAGNPSLIIADEPTTALDVSIESQILSELVTLKEELSASILMITHDLSVIRETCDRVIVMYAGEIMETAQTDDLFENPQHPYTQNLLRSIPRINESREWLEVIEGEVPSLSERGGGCPFRGRCEHAFEMCDQPLKDYDVGNEGEDGHVARCFLHEPDVTKQAQESEP
jgi:peptide/nickel transport system ATP-binding protein